MKMSSLMNHIKKMPKHLANGSLDAYISEEWKGYCQRRTYRERQHRIKWWASRYGSEGSVEVEIQPDVSMNLNFDSEFCKFLYVGNFETTERNFFNAYLRAGDTVLDAGANIGLFTLISAKIVGSQGHVHAFEPVGQVYERLQENIFLNRLDNVSAHQIALSDTTAETQIKTSLDGYDAWNSLAQPTAGETFKTESIQALKLDDFVAQYDLSTPIALMKIDVEGWESHLLRGGEKLFSQATAPTLLVEFTETNCQAAQSSCHSLYRQLEDYGYQMFTYQVDSRQLIFEPIRESYEYANLIATKNADFVRERVRLGSSQAWMR